MIDVVGADGSPGEFLGQVIFLIGDFGRDQNSYGIRAIFFFDPVKTGGSEIDGFIPGGFFKFAVFFDQGGFQPHIAVDVFVKIPSFDAQFAFIDGMGFQGQGGFYFSVNDFK
jgi:hypothetical protein